MTCVVAATDGHTVIIGGDSCAVDNSTISARVHPKVFRKGELAIGYCQSFRLGQILEYIFSPPPVPRTKDANMMEYMVKSFVPAMKKCLEENWYPYHDDEKEDWSIIVGVKGKIFYVESDYHVGHDINNYFAIGSGGDYALGAMYAVKDQDPRVMVRVGLEAAVEFSPFVKRPFNYVTI
jgi:ATP-dependent protease HslVU (ClpYQ) peptidase subunit